MVFAAFLVIPALILVNAVYVAAEFAAVSVRRSRVRQLAEEGHPLAVWLLPVLETPASLERYIAACQIGITVSGLVLGAYAHAMSVVLVVCAAVAFAGAALAGLFMPARAAQSEPSGESEHELARVA